MMNKIFDGDKDHTHVPSAQMIASECGKERVLYRKKLFVGYLL